MTALIIDDERLARQEMRRLLDAHLDVAIVGEAASATEAAEKIAALRPDLVFLDISMPDQSGFDLLASLDSVPRVVFVTAFDQFALKAFEVSALDYLLKPVQPARLAVALDKIREEISRDRALFSAKAVYSAAEKLGGDRQVFLKDGERCHFVRLAEVWLIESVGNYVRLNFDNQNALLHRSLHQLEQRLDESLFFRANRQEILNFEFVQRVEPFFNGTLRIWLKNGWAVEVSTRQAAVFRERLSL